MACRSAVDGFAQHMPAEILEGIRIVPIECDQYVEIRKGSIHLVLQRGHDASMVNTL